MAINYSSLQANYLRVVKLAPSGAPLTGTASVYTTDAFISVVNGLTISAGDDFEVKNANGAVCATYKDCDRIKGAEGSVALCQLDAELLALLTGSTLLDDGAVTPANVGLAVPSFDAACPDGVSMEVWTKAWAGNEPAVDGADRQYYRHVWPRVFGRLDGFTLENGFLEVPVAWTALGNSTLTTANGPDGDWPDGIGNSPYAYFLTTVVPTLSDGLTAFPIA